MKNRSRPFFRFDEKKKKGKPKIYGLLKKKILWTHRVENTLKLFDTYLFFILFRRFLFQLAHLLLDALQHRVRANGSLDYAFRRLGDASLHFWFLNIRFLGSQNVFPRPTEPTANTWVGKLIWLSGVWMVVGGFPRFLNLSPVDFSFISLIVVLHFYSLLRYECILVMNV